MSGSETGVRWELRTERVSEDGELRDRLFIRLVTPGAEISVPVEKETAANLSDALEQLI